jgi:cobyrinic acid a,c-diamide synthase
VVLNRIASPRHEDLVRRALADVGIAVFGALPRNGEISLPKRHLGLVQAEEQKDVGELIAAAARFVTQHVDLDAVLQAASRWSPNPATPPPNVTPPGQRIALARDAAFSFVYPHMLAAWRAAGAEILPFSPLDDQGPDAGADVCWLPGGYPELSAGRLAANANFRRTLRAFAETRPVHGECGGYMVMGEALTDADGVRHQMAGLLGLETNFAKRRMHLGYRIAELGVPMPGYSAGARLRGHEFHYTTVVSQPDEALALVRDATGTVVAETGSRRGRATGTFFHLIAEDR